MTQLPPPIFSDPIMLQAWLVIQKARRVQLALTESLKQLHQTLQHRRQICQENDHFRVIPQTTPCSCVPGK